MGSSALRGRIPFAAIQFNGIALVLMPLLVLAVAATAQERRELAPHEHGHSVLNLAIEGRQVTMELDAPGMDIVGFEHAATTEADKAAIAAAKVALEAPLTLFVLPAAANCRVTSASVKLGAEEGHAAAEGHTEFEAEYALDCARPELLTVIDFAYFKRFAGAEEVEVTIVTARGQSEYEVKRAAPRLALDAAK